MVRVRSHPILRRHPSNNVQVTHSPDLQSDRSESALAVNPLNPNNLIGASKRFSDPAKYNFVLAACSSFDAGVTWTEAAPLDLPAGAGHSSDPALAFDDAGNAYLAGLPLAPGDFANGTTLGISINRSTDGGKTWGPAEMIHSSGGDDKQGAAGDGNPASPYFGHVYVVWDDVSGGASTLRFARTTDRGASWSGVGGQPAGDGFAGVVSDSFAPEIVIAGDGSVYIIWLSGEETGTLLKFVKSTDGGDSFSEPHIAVQGLIPISRSVLGEHGVSFPQLPGGKFRVLSSAVGCAGSGKTIVVAWADYRDGVSRVYHRRSDDGGINWDGPLSGEPLLSGLSSTDPDQHDFHPQLAAMPNGEIACAFYEFGPKGGPQPRIDVVVAISSTGGKSFPLRLTVTDAPWDPAVNAPLSHGEAGMTFIGEYFGFVATDAGFYPLWTDTRTGVQELFSSQIAVEYTYSIDDAALVQILIGIIEGGGGIAITPQGQIIHVPPRGPVMELLSALAMYQIAVETRGQAGIMMQQAALALIADLAAEQARGLRTGGGFQNRQ